MKKNENSSSSSSQIIGIVVYLVAFLTSWYFVNFTLAGYARNAANAQNNSIMLSTIPGVIAQFQLLLS